MRYSTYPYSYANYYNHYQKPTCSIKDYANTNTVIANPTKKKEKKQEPSSNEDRGFFELLGIKLYFDDILLICLIFFLYTEGVQDEMLFLALVLLLLS